MTAVTIWDPTKWNPSSPSPAPVPVKKNACVDYDSDGHSYKGSPVFIQTIAEGQQSFASQRCIPCRFDQKHICRSARIVCPSSLGASIVEHTWLASLNCEGEPTRTVAVSKKDIRCPGPEHYGIDTLNLTRFVVKVQRDHPLYFSNATIAQYAIDEYRRMLTLVQKYPTNPIVPSKLVDLVWHEHILDTKQYKADCLRLFGYYLDHSPSFGGEDEKVELVDQQQSMLKLYLSEFEEIPRKDIWPSLDVPAQKLPDCCAAKCVKPDCQACVGCNAVDCGYLAGQRSTAGISSEKFSGYVPTSHPQDIAELSEWDAYQCKLTTLSGRMSLGWSIVGEYIHFKHEFIGLAWYGIGLSNQSGMGLADYMVSMNTKNYSGVKDMYVHTAAAGYPCWDVLYECSDGNHTRGTKDVEDDITTRTDGTTTTSWNRKLITPDYKDYEIMDVDAQLLLAYGDTDYFYYHGDNIMGCVVNFFNGNYSCWDS